MCGIRQLRLRIIITTGNRVVTSIFVTAFGRATRKIASALEHHVECVG
jgi:hypothetical protein